MDRETRPMISCARRCSPGCRPSQKTPMPIKSISSLAPTRSASWLSHSEVSMSAHCLLGWGRPSMYRISARRSEVLASRSTTMCTSQDSMLYVGAYSMSIPIAVSTPTGWTSSATTLRPSAPLRWRRNCRKTRETWSTSCLR